jgi:hypothetical protein
MDRKAERDRVELGSGAAGDASDHRRALSVRLCAVCLYDDVEAGVALLEVPLAHRRAVAPPSWFERLFDEERRRTRVLGTPSARDRAHIPTRLSSRNRT